MTAATAFSSTRTSLAIAFAFAAQFAVVADASATSARVTMACAGDYLAYCSQHPTEGAAVRQCMRNNGHKLSNSCVSALVAAGEVSKAEVARRSADAK